MAKDEYKPDQIRGHADEADGIEEYDNRLPTWWIGLFVFTIVWGAWIFIDWHIASPRSLASEYDEEKANAAPPIDLETIEIIVNAETVAAGAEVFAATCVACHQADASGGIGPSLIDDEWIHGSSPEEIRYVVATGVLEKGMPPWLPVIGPEKLAEVVAYVHSLTNPLDG